MVSNQYRKLRARRVTSHDRFLRSPGDRKRPVYRSGKFIIALLVLAAFGAAFLFYGDGLWYTWKHQQKLKELAQRNDSLRQLNNDMTEKIRNLKSGDKFTLEEEARYKGLAFDGEDITILQPKPENRGEEGQVK